LYKETRCIDLIERALGLFLQKGLHAIHMAVCVRKDSRAWKRRLGGLCSVSY